MDGSDFQKGHYNNLKWDIPVCVKICHPIQPTGNPIPCVYIIIRQQFVVVVVLFVRIKNLLRP